MPTVIPNRYGIFVAKLTGPGTRSDDSIVTCGLHRRPVIAGLDATWADCFTEARDGFRSFFSSLLHVGWTYVGCDLTYREGGVLQGLTASENVVGSIASPAPSYTSLVVQKRTNIIGRKFRGRMSVPGVVGLTNIEPDGTLSPATLAAYQPTVTALFNKLEWNDVLGGPGSYFMTPELLHSDSTPPTRVQSLTISSNAGLNKTRYR